MEVAGREQTISRRHRLGREPFQGGLCLGLFDDKTFHNNLEQPCYLGFESVLLSRRDYSRPWRALAGPI